MVDGAAAQAHALDGEHREVRLRVVVAGVVAERAFQRGIAGTDETLEQDLRPGRRVQAGERTAPDPRARGPQQAGEFVFGQRVRHGRHRRQQGGRIRADRHQHRERLVRMRGLPARVVKRTAAMRQPAHDHAIAANHLLPVDRHVLAFLAGAAGDDQAEGNQPVDILRPAALDRQPSQIDVVALQHLLVEGRILHRARRHVGQLRQSRPVGQGAAQVARPAWFLHAGQQFAQLAQRRQRPPVQRQFDAPAMAEQVAKQRMRRPGVVHQQRRPGLAQGTQAQRRAFQFGLDPGIDAQQLALPAQVIQEIAQIMERHAASGGGGRGGIVLMPRQRPH